jgi:hypothetical protein
MWSSVGSVGVLNSSDAGKVLFTGSIAQLGIGVVGPQPSAAAHVEEPRIEERMIGFPTVAATLRYPVQEVDLGDSGPGAWNLTVRYRDGNGSVVVQLMQVALATGVETLCVTLQSGVGRNRSNSFHDELSQGTFRTDFRNNAYYVAVTLTGPAFEIGIPPAIQLMQIGPA